MKILDAYKANITKLLIMTDIIFINFTSSASISFWLVTKTYVDETAQANATKTIISFG